MLSKGDPMSSREHSEFFKTTRLLFYTEYHILLPLGIMREKNGTATSGGLGGGFFLSSQGYQEQQPPGAGSAASLRQQSDASAARGVRQPTTPRLPASGATPRRPGEPPG